jgi:hypothetical protein
VVGLAVNLVYLLATMLEPYIPTTANKICDMLALPKYATLGPNPSVRYCMRFGPSGDLLNSDGRAHRSGRVRYSV